MVFHAMTEWCREAQHDAEQQQLRAMHSRHDVQHDDHDVGADKRERVVREHVLSAQARLIIEQMFGSDVFDAQHTHDHHHNNNTPKSIFHRLERFAHEPDEQLDPCATINSTLSELVRHLQAGTCDGCISPSEFCELQKQICAFIDHTPLASARASMIRDVATRAEGRLELFYAHKLLALSEQHTVNKQHDYVRRICEAAAEFPYTANYEHMVQKEYQVLRETLCCHHHAHNNNNSPRSVSGDAARDEAKQTSARGELRVAFCGSGPLPLSGLLLSALGDMHVTLIDCDEQAVAISRQLLHKWEALQIMPPNRVCIVCADAQQLRFARRGGGGGGGGDGDDDARARERREHIRCDVLFVAALLGDGARRQVLRDVRDVRDAHGEAHAPLVVLRTAHGLTARVAYQRACARRDGGDGRVALVVPVQHVDRRGHVLDEKRHTQPTHVFDAHILNSLELHIK